MTVRLEHDVIVLEGDCRVEEAETLLGLLQEAPRRVVDIGQCRHLHAALVQVLISFGAVLAGAPADQFMRAHVAPNFPRQGAEEALKS